MKRVSIIILEDLVLFFPLILFIFSLSFFLSFFFFLHPLSPDGSLYLCLPTLSIPPSQSLSTNCSLFFSHPNAPPPCQVSFLFGPSLLKISYSLLLPGDTLDLSSLFGSSYLVEVSSPPASLYPFVVTISGPSFLRFPLEERFFFLEFFLNTNFFLMLMILVLFSD